MSCQIAVKGQLRWYANVSEWRESESEWSKLLSIVDPAERARIERFVHRIDAKRALVGRLLIRKAVSGFHQIQSLGDVVLGRTKQGKPYAVVSGEQMESNFNVNVSHHGDLVVLAAEPCMLCGVDVSTCQVTSKRDKSIDAFIASLRSVLSAREWAALNALGDDTMRLARFTDIWTLKEAYIKAIGIGFGLEPSRLSFELDDDECTATLDGRALGGWRFERHRIDDLHFVAVALGPPGDAIASYRRTLPCFAAASSSSKARASIDCTHEHCSNDSPAWQQLRIDQLTHP
jgi:4'-phosphopantetheinyl transferase